MPDEQKRRPAGAAVKTERLGGASTGDILPQGAANVKHFTIYLHNGGEHPATKESGLKPTLFPTESVIVTLDDLKRATGQAHTAARFTGAKRADKNFESADVIILDIDGPDWKGEAGAERIRAELGGLRYMAATSASRAWHVFFALAEPITDTDRYRKLKRRIAERYSFFDKNAVDTSRFFYANPGAAVFEAEGDFVDEAAADWAEPETAPPPAPLLRETAHDPRWEQGTMPDGSRTAGLAALCNHYANHGRSLDELLAVVARNWPEAGAKLDNALKQARNLYAGSLATSTRATAPETELTTPLAWEHSRAPKLAAHFCHTAARGWLAFTGGCWRHEGAEAALFRAVDAEAKKFWADCFTSRNKQTLRLGSALREARFLRGEVFTGLANILHRADADFDATPELVNCAGLAVNLRTGETRPAEPTDFFTRSAACRPEQGEPSRFMDFVLEVTGNDPELAAWIVQFFGRALLGRKSDSYVLNLLGAGGNGKSVLQCVMQFIFGEYARALPPELFLAKRYGQETERLFAGLEGVRLGVAPDTPSGTLNCSNLKTLTGGDTVTARALYKERLDFTPCAALCLSTNAELRLPETGEAVRRRIRQAAFCWHGKPDRTLEAKLKAEAPRILAMLITEARLYLADIDAGGDGFPPCASIEAQTSHYIDAQDLVKSWMDAEGAAAGLGTPRLARETAWEIFKAWYLQETDRLPKKRDFKDGLTRHGYREAQVHGGARYYRRE